MYLAINYDEVGNRIREIFNSVRMEISDYSYYPGSNRLMTDGSYGYIYDDAGNLIEKGNRYNIEGDSVIFTETEGEGVEYYKYEYNLQNRLSTVQKNGEVIANFNYDADGMRVKAEEVLEEEQTSRTTYYVYNYSGKVLLEESSDTGDSPETIYTSYVYAFSKAFAKVDGVINVATLSSTEISYFHYDNVGSTRLMTDNEGKVIMDQDYLPFGGDLPKIGQTEVLNEDKEGYKYTGQREVVSIGLYYYGARYYDPSIGRFITEDSYPGEIATPQSQNLYLYVMNNPLRYVDPTGHFIQESEHQRRPGDDPYPNSSPGNKTNSSGKKKNESSFNLNVKPNLNPLLDLNGDHSFENDWDMSTGVDVRITVEQMNNSMDIESIAPKFELKDGLISLEHTHYWPAKITFFGGKKVENITKLNINIKPDSEWSVSSDGTGISYQKGDLDININNKGEMVIKNGKYTTEIKNGGYYMDNYTTAVITGSSNDYFNVKVSSQALIFSSNWRFMQDVVDGYVPLVKHKVEISDKQGYISLSNETTLSINSKIRDAAYIGLGLAGGKVAIAAIIKMINSGYDPTVIPQN